MDKNLKKIVSDLAVSDEATRGAFYTKQIVASFMLDILGYRLDTDLTLKRLLDPCFGEGVFFVEALRRLLVAAKRDGKLNVDMLKDCLCGVEIGIESFANVKRITIALLQQSGMTKGDAVKLASYWLFCADFLFFKPKKDFDFIVGNPPYMRLERINKDLLDAYRKKFATMGNRSDLYVAFFEHSLSMLRDGGAHSFICADRWLKNRYGQELRMKIRKDYQLSYVLSLHDADPFESRVSAYPAIFLITNKKKAQTIYRELQTINAVNFKKELNLFDKEARVGNEKSILVTNTLVWFSGPREVRDIFINLESSLPTLEQAGIKVGIGAATGCDRMFILTKNEARHIERDRLLKVALRGDIQNEQLRWSGNYLINTFDNSGDLIDLDKYPKLKKHFLSGEELLRERHVSKKKPHQWFRTIDKPILPLLKQPRLYIPDIMHSPKISYTSGDSYPHHNLYWVTSDTWNLRALRTVLKSAMTFLYVDAFSTKIHGGYYRYQAQTLRKIRVPQWAEIDPLLKEQLISLHDSRDYKKIDNLVFNLYGFSGKQKNTLFKTSEQYGLALSRLRKLYI